LNTLLAGLTETGEFEKDVPLIVRIQLFEIGYISLINNINHQHPHLHIRLYCFETRAPIALHDQQNQQLPQATNQTLPPFPINALAALKSTRQMQEREI